jgi:hypothetical protein
MIPTISTPKDRADRIMRNISGMSKEGYTTLYILLQQEIRDAELVSMNGTLEVVARVLEKSSESLEKDVPELAPSIPAVKSFARSMAKTFRDQMKDRHLYRGDKKK